ncbi:GNAT family N-acetyltransferase [Mycolicibacterium monacense]|uniref:Lysine N-acyltransferase MbtK n=1 Tax=Mycolicibacterium monacense TaxID=85693 RepID=A0AAD1IWB2_MYCMB|nr:GNAT family N-acetyltransferase [Mycolicibacterium monacense]MDA4105454.1 siderophore biosynthesis protein [Mycolicibacterium monacense DSM 44395]ORB19350.1 acetyltransferase [Mycolicibacterium monacense DSM 44395]QHP85451.1 N-acetyltransferase [Mycolicibacterium monacense DSM 44395]BBZ61664.1 siderophore biosynthesis protein [Mycolicibacterium monacense]
MTEIDEALKPVLPRELTTVSDEVRAVPAPPLPVLAEPFALRPADADADAEMISEWMNRPHLVEAWEYPWPPQRWRRHLQAQIDGEYSRPLIGSIDGADIAYLELYRAAKDSIAPRYAADPYDIGIHVAIADLDFVNRGLAPSLLPRVVASLFEAEPRCRRIMFDPDHRNTAARRVCEAGGCAFLGEHDMTNRRMALYALPRTPQDAPPTAGS